MKKYGAFILAVLFLFTGCSMMGGKKQQGSEGAPAKAVAGKTAAGTVTINYTLTRISGRSSNQYAVWIEDGAGKYIRTLFVTDYMARRQGWKVRQQSLATWVKAANVPNMPQQDLDAISGPTPQAGTHSAVWDLKDAAGRPVPAGVYTYRIEGSLLSENTVLWTGKISVGGARQTSRAAVSYFPEGADKLGRTLISDVSAVYDPTP
ncbi:MAG: DUF2271 domain-containing protein [Candidatus Latescibacterota bacterium]